MTKQIWQTKLKKQCFDGGEAVTALSYAYRCVYAGCATGRIAVFRIVAGNEDMATLQEAAKEMERLGYGKNPDAFRRKGMDSRAGAVLREVVRLDYAYMLDCHSSTITAFCLAGGVFFSAATDMAIVSWMKPVDSRNRQFATAPAQEEGGRAASTLTQKYGCMYHFMYRVS